MAERDLKMEEKNERVGRISPRRRYRGIDNSVEEDQLVVDVYEEQV